MCPWEGQRKLKWALPMNKHKCYQEEGSRKYSLLTLPQRCPPQARFLKVCLKLDKGSSSLRGNLLGFGQFELLEASNCTIASF